MSESFKVRSGLYQSSKSSTSDSINNHQVINLLGSMKGRCVAKEASTPTGWMEAMLSRLTTQKSDRQKASHPKEKGERKSKVVELRYSKLSLEDRQYLKSQMAIWFPCVVHRPTLSELEAALAEIGSRIMRGVTAFHAMDLNPGLTESKVQRQLFRNRHRSLKQRDVQLLMSTWSRKTVDLAGCAEECGKLERKLTSMSLVSAKLNTLCAKKSSNSFIYGEKNWRHSLMSCDVETSSVSPREEMRANCDVDQARLLLLYDKRTYDVPRWFHWLVEKGATIDLELIHPEPVDGPVVEARELLERPRRISLHIMPPGISSMVKGHMFVSIIEQEQMRPVVNKCVNISTNNVASSSPARMLLMSMKASEKTLSLHRPEKDLETETTTKTCAHCESWYEQNDERSSQDDFFPEERTISFEHKWAYVLPKHGVKFKKAKLKQKKNIKVPRRFDLKIPYDKESSVLINTESQDDAKAQLDIPVNKQTGRESEKSNVEIRSAVKAQSNKFSRKLRNLLRKSFRDSSHSPEVVKTKTCKDAEILTSSQILHQTQNVKRNERCGMKQEYLSFSLRDNSKERSSRSQCIPSELMDKSLTHKNAILNLCLNTSDVQSDDACSVTQSPRYENTEIRSSNQKREPRNRMVRFSNNDRLKPMDKSNSSLSDPYAVYTPGFLFDDIASSQSIDCVDANERSSNTDAESVKPRTKPKLYRPNATFVKKTYCNNGPRKISGQSGKDEHRTFYIKDCLNDAMAARSDSNGILCPRGNQSAKHNENQSTKHNCNSDDNSTFNNQDNVRPTSPVSSVKFIVRKGIVLNETYQSCSLSDFVKEQWRSGHSSSSREHDDCSLPSDDQSSCAASRSELLKCTGRHINNRQTGTGLKPRNVSNKIIREQNGHNLPRQRLTLPTQTEPVESRHDSCLAEQDEQALFKEDDTAYREDAIPGTNSATGPLHSSRGKKTMLLDKAKVETEYNDNNEHSLTAEASTSTSSELKMSTPTTTTKEVSSSLSSPDDHQVRDNRPVNHTWLTLKDLGSLLTYCSKIISTNEPLAEGTIKILKAVNETLSWYFLEEETLSPSLDKGRIKSLGNLLDSSGKHLQEKEKPNNKLKFKHRDSHELNTIKCKARSGKVRLSKWTDCMDLRSQLTRKAPLSRSKVGSPDFLESSAATSIHLDETQNKLDSEDEEQVEERRNVRSTPGLDSGKQLNRKRSSLDDLERWQLAGETNNDNRSPKSHESKQETMPVNGTNMTYSMTDDATRFDRWSDQVHQTPFSSLPAPLFESGSAQHSKNERMAPKRAYFEQKDFGQNSEDLKNFERRCNPQRPFETDLTCCPPGDHCPPWHQSSPLNRCPTEGANCRTMDCHCFPPKRSYTCKPHVAGPPCTHDNTTSSCLADHCMCSHPYSIPPKHYSLSRCLDCLDRVDCCGSGSRKRSRKPFYDWSFGCPRTDLSGFPARLESAQPSRVQTSTFDFPRSRYNFPATSTLRPCWQTVGDMTSEFERKFKSPVDVTFQRKIPISENLNLYTGDLAETTMIPEVSPVARRYPNLVPNLGKKRAKAILKSDVDQRSTCDKEIVQRETLEYITELLKTCLCRDRHTDGTSARCSSSETKLKTCQLSDDDRRLMESLKSKLDSKLLQRLMQTEKDNDPPQAPPLTRKSVTCEDETEKSFDCLCCPKKCDKPNSKPDKCDSKIRGGALNCACCLTDSKNKCEPKPRRMYCKGLQADMSWAAARCRETSVQTCDCVETRSKRCICCRAENIDPRLTKLSCKCLVPGGDGHCFSDGDRAGSPSCMADGRACCRDQERWARCAVVEDISSCTHLGSPASGSATKRNKSIQTSITCPLDPSHNRFTLCKPSPCFRPDNSICRSASDIYPKIFPDRMEQLTSKYRDTACGQLRNKYRLNKSHIMSDACEETACASYKTRDTRSFYVKKWDSPSECSTLMSDFKGRLNKPARSERSPPNYPSLKPSYKTRRQKNMFPESTGKSKIRVKGSNWLDFSSSKSDNVCKEPAPEDHCQSESPEANRPIVHIRYKSRKVNGKSEITVDSVPHNEDRVTSPVRNLALQLKKHVEQIIQNSKELKQQALNNKRCPKRSDGANPQSEAKSSCKDNKQGMVKFHTSRKDDGAWSYEVKIKSPVCQPQDKMSESYVSQNVNCGNNSDCGARHSNYGVTVDVTMPETCVDDDTDKLIQDVLPGIFKIILCVILKVKGCANQEACNELTFSSQHQRQLRHQNLASENFNSNANTDKSDDDHVSRLRHSTCSTQKRTKKDSCTEGKIIYRKKCPNRRIRELRCDQRYFCLKSNVSEVKGLRSHDCRFENSDVCDRVKKCHVHPKTQLYGYTWKQHSGKQSHTTPGCGQEIYWDDHTSRQTTQTAHGCGEIENGKTVGQSKGSKSDAGSHRIISRRRHTTIIEDLSSLASLDDTDSVIHQHGERKDLSRCCRATQLTTSPCSEQSFKPEREIRIQRNGRRKMTRMVEDVSSRQTPDDTWGVQERSRLPCQDWPRTDSVAMFSHPDVFMECSDSTPRVHTTLNGHPRLNPETSGASYSRELNIGQKKTVGAQQHHGINAMTTKRKSGQSYFQGKMRKPACYQNNSLHCKGDSAVHSSSQQTDSLPCKDRDSLYISFYEELSVTPDSAASSHGIEDIPLDSGTGTSRLSSHRVSDGSQLQCFVSACGKKRRSRSATATKDETTLTNSIEGGRRQFPDRQRSVESDRQRSVESDRQRSVEPDRQRSVESDRQRSVESDKINTAATADLTEVREDIDSNEDAGGNDQATVNDSIIQWWNAPNAAAYHAAERSEEKPSSLPGEATVPGDDLSKKCPVGGWMTCRDSSISMVHPAACDESTGTRNSTICQPLSAVNDLPVTAVDIPKDSSCSQDKHKVISIIGEVAPRHGPGNFKSEGNQSWENAFISSAELTEATSDRVVLEGTFFKSTLPGDRHLGHREQGSSFLPQNSTSLLPFRLVLFAAGERVEGKVISGTYLRRMVSIDRFFKWNFKFDIPICDQ